MDAGVKFMTGPAFDADPVARALRFRADAGLR